MIPEEVTSCQVCGEDPRYVSFIDACPLCSKPGPFCDRCLVHHQKHCEGKEDISENEDCSECEDGLTEDEETQEDRAFKASDDDEDEEET